MFLDNVDWSLCRNQLQKIRLVSSPIDGRAAQHLAATFPELRELFLDYGYLRQPAEAFEIAENFSEEQALRRRLPRCRVSYYDCHVESLYDTCSGQPQERQDVGVMRYFFWGMVSHVQAASGLVGKECKINRYDEVNYITIFFIPNLPHRALLLPER